MSSIKGYFCPVLHAHLPFVRHPEYSDMMEERWLYEAITETYLPLLDVFERLESDGVKFRLTMSITPPLANMLADELLINRYSNYLSKQEELSEKEIFRNAENPEFGLLARIYHTKFKHLRAVFEKWDRHLIKAFKHFQDAGFLEIITCCATHAFLPLIGHLREAVSAQIEMAVKDYEYHFGKAPNGIWLAECAYNPGDDELLKKFGIKFFFTDTHGIAYADKKPSYGTYAPIECPSGVTAFGRDIETGRQVWSSEVGYPGDPIYREFYRDIGFELDMDYISPYIHESGIRMNTGIKYYRITEKHSEQKEPYDYSAAMRRVCDHANHFLFCREQQIKYFSTYMSRKPIVVAMYDCELFGHWWYEGPEFIYNILRKISVESSVVDLCTPSDYLREYPENEKAIPSASTWGAEGYNYVWLNDTNSWIYPHIHKATERMIELAKRFPNVSGLKKRVLNQAARELMLLQSSDWAFILTNNTTTGYAKNRIKAHVFRFNKLYDFINEDKIDEAWLAEVENRDKIFPEMDYRIFK